MFIHISDAPAFAYSTSLLYSSHRVIELHLCVRKKKMKNLQKKKERKENESEKKKCISGIEGGREAKRTIHG